MLPDGEDLVSAPILSPEREKEIRGFSGFDSTLHVYIRDLLRELDRVRGQRDDFSKMLLIRNGELIIAERLIDRFMTAMKLGGIVAQRNSMNPLEALLWDAREARGIQ